MSLATPVLMNTGLEVIDIRSDASFAARTLRARDIAKQMEGVQRIARAFVESPETILQQLVDVAVELAAQIAQA